MNIGGRSHLLMNVFEMCGPSPKRALFTTYDVKWVCVVQSIPQPTGRIGNQRAVEFCENSE